MPLPTFDKKTDIPKGFEDEYEEKDGKFVPIDRTAKALQALQEERDARKAAEVVAQKAARDLADANAKQQAAAAGMTEAKLKELYTQVEDAVRKEYDPKLKEADTLRSENRTLKLTNVVKQMFKEGRAVKGREDDFWKLHGDEFDLTSDGKPMVKNEPGKDVAKHVAAIMKQRPEWVQGTSARGGGAGGTTGAGTQGGGSGTVSFEDLLKNPGAAVASANES
jgi:hypothetical protein